MPLPFSGVFAPCPVCSPLTITDPIFPVPERTEEIGEEAFRPNASLTKGILPDSVRRIRSAAFEYCRGLTGFAGRL